MNRSVFPSQLIPLLALSLALPLAAQQPAVQAPPNLLFIAVDDLRPEIGAFGSPAAITPNLDRLAASGVRFQRHYIQVPTCGASRFALLTGRYPRTAEALGNEAFVRLLPGREEAHPESWAHHFRRNGYRTVALGKISHYPDGRVFSYTGEGDGRREMPLSWDEVWGPAGRWGTAWNAFFAYADGSSRTTRPANRRPAFERGDGAQVSYPDDLTADTAVARLRSLAATPGQPFLLAVGFFKPHLPFTAPRRYWDLYDRDRIALSANPAAPAGVNPGSIHASGEMFNSYAPHASRGGAGVRIDDEHARTLRHAYLAAVSYVDDRIGRVLDELDRLGLRDNTIVVLWSDHGWHLGDHTVWGKHTTLERSLLSPLVVRVPGTPHAGRASDAIVESVDLYPTLAELAGLPVPAGLDGRSFLPTLREPSTPSDGVALGFYPGRRTLRTDRWRIVEWERGDPRVELFDHHTDPRETTNVAAGHPEVVRELLARLRAEAPEIAARVR